MTRFNPKGLILAAGIALIQMPALAQQPQPAPTQPRKVVCIVESDSAMLQGGHPGCQRHVWTSTTGSLDSSRTTVRKVIVINTGSDSAQVDIQGLEDGFQYHLGDAEAEGQKVIVKKEVVADAKQGGKAQVHTLRIVNGDTVENSYSEEAVGDGVFILDSEGQPGSQVDVDIRDDGQGTRVVVVRLHAVRIAELEDEERARYAPNKAESLHLKDLEYYPNPNQGRFTLSFRLKDKAAPAQVRVMSIDGKVLLEQMVAGHDGRVNQEIDLGRPAAGVYLLEIAQDGHRAVKRIVVE